MSFWDKVRQFFAPLANQWNSSKRPLLITKVVIFSVAYTFMVLNAIKNLAQPGVVPDCLLDTTHEVTQSINQYLAQNATFKNALIIVSSLMVDITIIASAAVWIIYGRSMKLCFAVITFYVFKIFLQEVFFFRFPPDYIWGYPGFPSISTPYYPSNDFFFSGQIGLCMISLMNFRTHKVSIFKYFALVTIIVEFFVLIVTRAHYIIDLTTGVVAGHYFYMVGSWIDEFLQRRKQNKNFELQPETRPLLVENTA